MKTVVPSPPAAAPRVGLLVSANSPADENGRWQNGIAYDPETGATGYRTDPCSPGEQDRALDAPPEAAEWEPYVVGSGYRCTALAAGRIDWRARARRLLEAEAERQISAELWTGSIATAEGHPNRALAAGAEDVSPTAGGPRGTLAALEQYLADYGQRGMIHAPRALVSAWAQDGGLRRDGGLILTIHDTIVVPGAGYPDDGIAVATGMVDVRRGPVDVFGGPDSPAIDRETNEVLVRAEQIALASWDGTAHASAAYDLT